MERKSLVVVFSILVLILLAAQEVVVKTEALTEEVKEALTEALTDELKEAQTEVLTEAQTEVLTEAQTEVAKCVRRLRVPCRVCNATCVRRGGIRGYCKHRRCFCVFRRCPPISDVLTEAQTEELTEALTEELTEVLTEVQTETLTEALTEAQMEEQTEAETEVAACWRRIPFHGPCIGPIGNRRCHAACVRRRAIRSRCRGGKCFCLFPRCPHISDVTEELKEELTEALTEAKMEEQTEAETEVEAYERPIPFLGRCNNRWCNHHCRKIGAKRGFCRGGRCICVYHRGPAISDVLEE